MISIPMNTVDTMMATLERKRTKAPTELMVATRMMLDVSISKALFAPEQKL